MDPVFKPPGILTNAEESPTRTYGIGNNMNVKSGETTDSDTQTFYDGMDIDSKYQPASDTVDDVDMSDSNTEYLDAENDQGEDVSTYKSTFQINDDIDMSNQQPSILDENASQIDSKTEEMPAPVHTLLDINGSTSTRDHLHPEKKKSRKDEQSQHKVPLDLADGITGLYRILDLISEQGSGGLVDKIIIAQESSGRFINDIKAGAYKDLTNIDFKAMDDVLVRPLGIYGSKSEIIRFLCEMGAIDNEMGKLLNAPQELSNVSPSLRPGLYALTVPGDTIAERRLYVIFWPEDTTWDDNAVSAVRRNRITFMRYLTKITDQIMVLISEEHDHSLVWDDPNCAFDDDGSALTFDDIEEETDRLFSFEVSKANEQEESVKLRQGFEMRSPYIQEASSSYSASIDPSRIKTRLVVGETKQCVMTVEHIAPRREKKILNETFRNKLQLISHLLAKDTVLRLDKNINYDAILILLENGLKTRFPEAATSFEERERNLTESNSSNRKTESEKIRQMLNRDEPKLIRALATSFVRKIMHYFPKLDEALIRDLRTDEAPSIEAQALDQEFLQTLLKLNPRLEDKLAELAPDVKFASLRTENRAFSIAMHKVFLCEYLFRTHELSESQRRAIWKLVDTNSDGRSLKDIGDILKDDDSGAFSNITGGILKVGRSLLSFATTLTSSEPIGPIKEARGAIRDLKSGDFFLRADDMRGSWPELEQGIATTYKVANDYFAKLLQGLLRSLPHKLLDEHFNHCMNQLDLELGTKLEEGRRSSREQFISEIESALPEGDLKHVVVLEKLERRRVLYSIEYNYPASGYHIISTDPSLKYTLYSLELTEDHKQQMKMNANFIPQPQIAGHRAYSFNLSTDSEIRLLQPIEGDRCLVVVEDHMHDLCIYLESMSHLHDAISNRRPKKVINREKTGHDILMTYDEGKRIMVVCGVDHQKSLVQLHYFGFDERYTSLMGQGSPINLSAWYTPDIPRIDNIHFISGSDEVALVEKTGKVRIFSSITQQFRPAVLQLHASPSSTFGTPDGSCFGAVFFEGGNCKVQILHWTSLGSHEGFSFDFDIPSSQIPHISSLSDRKNVHLLWLDAKTKRCLSAGLDITRQITEFQFREKTSHTSSQNEERRTLHNSLLDCHSDVWTRFPVVPAVRRQAITSSELRQGRKLGIVTASSSNVPFADYFQDQIQKFEKSTKKPTATQLSGISVTTSEFDKTTASLSSGNEWIPLSVYKAGEWLVDVFCLIPIHIAVARDNRFIPLKDGILSSDYERALLGADVGRVADSLSFGWYESIFQSYMSTKPVKVVSSMGEQSVGKSFALNHLADTSFAGSAMRTTEGVWMSVTPTEDDMIVTLDFEGVHSIERSAQEDTLLVLFNAAISNLVLFRNNFALSRDITDLFQSFQASSSVLDPDANPSLFQSTLVIIIKDVVDSDRIEIAREFKLKLHKIVQEEQASNFISRLYRGRLNIIPWPVIESRQFYTLFSTLKKHLDGQSPTHEGGGAFLLKLKMLMAKLKTNDWGSLSQNMATHRAQHLLSLLSRALRFGATEVETDAEPLKNFDTNETIGSNDSLAVFWLDGEERPESRVGTLRTLLSCWPEFESRSQKLDSDWIACLCEYLQELADLRVAHVQAWIDSNLSQFKGSNSAIEELRRTMDTKSIELKRSVHLCKAQCERCHLLCINTRFHEGGHDCSTNHTCPRTCQFIDEHVSTPDPCSLLAGHEGEHICDPMAHLCGHECDLKERKGCQGSCTKVANHEDTSHQCSTRRHLCGEPCSLQNARNPSGKAYSCQGTCTALWDETHETHLCDVISCPIACELCGRLCATSDHLHGLKSASIHLCAQEHKCTLPCDSIGVCEIDTVPQSIEATFSGAHDQFQYTKYSQVTKRLQCAIFIPPGHLVHAGPHIHSSAVNPFHYCDARCDNCGYVCTLPQGHSQPEHSTNHGSMSQTRWVVDGTNGGVLELDGHKFGSNDDGAPMLCNLMCSSMGRHAHIDYCRASDPKSCSAQETDHIHGRIEPDPDRPKDWISHKLYWRRLGFKDPYSHEDQSNFAKCDAMCCGTEHQATSSNPAQPSYCSLPIFHQPTALNQAPNGGHVSNDGHAFMCKNPAILTQAFHVIFVIDRSGSMTYNDRKPLAGHPASDRIVRVANNRLGAVYSALHSFWSARAHAMNQASVQARRDAYSAILFRGAAEEIFSNDFTSTPDALLNKILPHTAGGGTNFDSALTLTERVMTSNWSTERAPVIVFLSDGECSMTDDIMYTVCQSAVRLGALSFQAVSFGPEGSSTWLRRMVQISKEVQDRAPRDPLLPANAIVESSYSIALDSVRLSETFLGIAESLRKTRGGLIR